MQDLICKINENVLAGITHKKENKEMIVGIEKRR